MLALMTDNILGGIVVRILHHVHQVHDGLFCFNEIIWGKGSLGSFGP